MIDTLFFALQIIGIVIVLGWAMIHDQQRDGAPTRGPLAFKRDGSAAGDDAHDRKKRPGLTRRRGQANLKIEGIEPE